MTISESVTRIASRAFKDCRQLEQAAESRGVRMARESDKEAQGISRGQSRHSSLFVVRPDHTVSMACKLRPFLLNRTFPEVC